MYKKLVYAVILSSAAFAPTAIRAEVKIPVPAFDQAAVAKRSYFYVGGKYVGDPGKEIMQGQIYVEVPTPKKTSSLPHRIDTRRSTNGHQLDGNA